ncbi:MAG TPA: FAD-dependent oxidoreductase, partial [Gaiellaceae bacterium]|nr:FAD-dependent oxidoreductase [Gaiellaceae bacterium]
ADVAVVGGGYLGLWSAWHLAEAGADVVVLEAEVCGHGPSGRNGGFVSSLWDQLPGLIERFGQDRAVAVGRASADAVPAIGAWCEAEAVDAWYRAAPQLELATTPAQNGAWEPVARACAAAGLGDECRELSAAEVQEICVSPVFGGGLLLRTNATVQPARLALGLRRRLIERGVRIHEHSPVLRLGERAETAGGRVLAGSTVLAVNSATAGFPGFGRALAVASSHIVLTEPVPEVLEELGWTGGEALADARTLLHYFRTTPDGRIAFGWGGGRMGYGARRRDVLERDADAVEHARRSLVRFFPQLAGRRITHAWGGPIDVSPTHLPSFGSHGRVHHGYGFTGNGVGPSYLGGRILASLALDRRDDVTGLALVEPAPARFPPEPLRFVGGSAIRRALVASDAAADSGGRPGPVTNLVASLPRRLGLHLPR